MSLDKNKRHITFIASQKRINPWGVVVFGLAYLFLISIVFLS